jgi:hypothetical protein
MRTNAVACLALLGWDRFLTGSETATQPVEAGDPVAALRLVLTANTSKNTLIFLVF